MRLEDLVAFAKENGLQDYLPPDTRGGKRLSLDRGWLIIVSSLHFSNPLH